VFKRLWNYFVDVRVTFWLLLSISSLLMIGSFYIKFYPHIFRPLNELLFQDWYRLYGVSNPLKLWWLFILIVVLIVLSMNTAACTLTRLKSLWLSRQQMRLRKFSFKITPSIIHICFIVMLSGHFLSMVTGYTSATGIVPGSKIPVSKETTIEILDKQCDNYSSPASMRGLMSQCTVFLKSETTGAHTYKQVGILEPAFLQGYSFHLGMGRKTEMPRLVLTIKRDHGLKLILAGFSLMIVLMLWYFPQLHRSK
jgi:hypothetical protein